MANLFLLIGIFLASGAANAECLYKAVPPERLEKLKKKEDEIAARALKMSVTDSKAIAVMQYCQKASFTNDAGNLYLDLKKDQTKLKESMATKPGLVASSSQWMTVFGAMFKQVKNPLLVKGAVGSAAIALNSVVGTSCIMNLELMAKGYSHKERTEYFNEVFDIELLKWELEEKQTSKCSDSRKALVSLMHTMLDLTRSQLTGSSQVLELLPAVANKGSSKTFSEIYPAAAGVETADKNVVQHKAAVKKESKTKPANSNKKNAAPASEEKEYAESAN